MSAEPASTHTVTPFHRNAAVPREPMPPVAENPILEFAAEAEAAGEPVQARAADGRVPPGTGRMTVLWLAGLVAIALAALVFSAVFTPVEPSAASGSLRVESDPPGAEVIVDAISRGTTPVSLTLPEGTHTVTVQQGSSVKRFPVDIAGGAGKDFFITWAEPAPAAPPASGSLYVAADAPGTVVSVDGAERGRAPLTVRDLAPGPHDVVVRSGNVVHRRAVQVEAGATASLVISGTTTAADWGWVSVDSPFVVQVLEGERVIGTSEVDRIMLPPGDHELDIVSEPYGFRHAARVRVAAGRGRPIRLTIPQAAININAIPWAQVFINGAPVGETPLADMVLPIGEYEIIFRHPQFGEKREVARVTLRQPPRISVDMRTQ